MESVKNAGKSVANVGKRGAAAGSTVFTDFKAFINKGSVVDLAVALIIGILVYFTLTIGAAFTAIVKSVVADLITPIIGLAGDKQLENIFAYLEKPSVCKTSAAEFDQTICDSLNTLKLAQEAGGVTWNYGRFIQTVINFFLVAVILFFIIKAFLRKKAEVVEEEEVTTRECPYCLSEVKIKAIKCAFCASTLPEATLEIVVKSE
jgi:large conductance mechanosensitive channel